MVLLHPKNFDLHRISCFGNKGSHCESEGTSDYQGNFVEHQFVIYINFVVRGFTAKRHQRFVVGTIDVHYLEHWEILRILSFFTLNYYTCLNLNEVFLAESVLGHEFLSDSCGLFIFIHLHVYFYLYDMYFGFFFTLSHKFCNVMNISTICILFYICNWLWYFMTIICCILFCL